MNNGDGEGGSGSSSSSSSRIGLLNCGRCRRLAWPAVLVALLLQSLAIGYLLIQSTQSCNKQINSDQGQQRYSTPFNSSLAHTFSSFYTFSAGTGTRIPKAGIESVLVTTKTDPPFHMFVYPDTIDRYISKGIAANGVYEPSTTAFMYRLFPKKMMASGSGNLQSKKKYVVVDLGSNLGYYSLLLASRGAYVISFEASPDTAWLQRSSAALNGLLPSDDRGCSTSSRSFASLKIINKGVSDETSTGRLSRHMDSPGMTSFSKIDKYNLQKGESGTALDVDIELVRAANVLEDYGIPTTEQIAGSGPEQEETTILYLLKIDVEGFELKALKGLELGQFKFRHIVMEYFPDMLRAAGTDPPDMLNHIQSFGYKFYEIRGVGGNLHAINGGDTTKGLRNWAEEAEKQGRGDFHINLFASLDIGDLQDSIA